MPRTTSTIPEDLHALIEGAIEAGVFENKSDAIRHALREYFADHEDARLGAAIELYRNGSISLGKAARLAGVSRFDMPEVLREHGVTVRLGPEDDADAEAEVEAARDLE